MSLSSLQFLLLKASLCPPFPDSASPTHKQTERLEFGGERGLLQGHAKRWVTHAPKPWTSWRFQQTTLNVRWGRGMVSKILTGKFGLGIRNEAGQRLTEFCQENALVITNTLFQQHKRRLYTWTSPDGQHQNQIDYILCSQRWISSVQSAKTRPGADCGSDHELLIAKFRLKLKKVGKTTRPFRYDLNQIP